MRYFHGSELGCLSHVNPTRKNGDGFLICGAASFNVARRYGPFVTEIVVEPHNALRLTPSEWLHNDARIKDQSYDAVIVNGDPEDFDFPVDVVHIRDAACARIIGRVPESAHAALDDGLPFSNGPQPGERGWNWYVQDIYGGDFESALEDAKFAA